MTRFSAALALALTLGLAVGGPAAANTGPIFLPDFTFPEPVTTPDVSTQGIAED